LFAALRADGQGAAMAQFDSNLVETGNPFMLRLIVPHNVGEPLMQPFGGWDSLIPAQNVLSQNEWQSDGAYWKKDIKLIAFDADTLQLPPLNIPLKGGRSAQTQPLELEVIATPSPDDPNDLEDIKDIIPEPPLWTDYLPWIFTIGGLIFAAVLAYWLIGRYKSLKNATSRHIEIPPHAVALRRLDALAVKNLWQNGLVKEYYAELTDILREYLEKRFNIPALESTSSETIRHLSGGDFPVAKLPALQDLLEQADLAKFAKIDPTESFHTFAIKEVRTLVENTKAIAADTSFKALAGAPEPASTHSQKERYTAE
jgi:hypothetical protein